MAGRHIKGKSQQSPLPTTPAVSDSPPATRREQQHTSRPLLDPTLPNGDTLPHIGSTNPGSFQWFNQTTRVRELEAMQQQKERKKKRGTPTTQQRFFLFPPRYARYKTNRHFSPVTRRVADERETRFE